MKAIIAEKPSVARDLARIVGATNKNDGYLEGNGYMVTWAFGHLIQLAMPQAYGYERFSKENLPIIPDEFKHIVRQTKSGKEWKTDSSANKQLKVIKEVFDKSDSIIVATDAGREGELIFRLIYHHLKCTKPFERLWISSLTDQAIKDGLKNLQPGQKYDDLYRSAMARSEADWLVGINATQAMTVSAQSGTYSLGRVQTPTLAMVCSRFIENRDFHVSKYWQLKAVLEKFGNVYDAHSVDKWENKDEVQTILKRLKDAKVIKVLSVEEKEVNQEPPLLYDLTALQKEANTKLNLSADKTLSIVQGLYEKKYLSYPRTGSRYISEDVYNEIPSRVKLLEKYPELSAYAHKLDGVTLNKKSVNDSKVTDHHALIITENLPRNLEGDEKAIYEIVASRMLEAFMDKCVKVSTTVTMAVDDIKFQIKGSRIKILGWRVVRFEDDNTDEEEISSLPEFYEGEELPLKDVVSVEKQTRPKQLHTEASLLSAMETAGKDLEDEELRERIKDSGIGTPATRANIIETLLARGYIERKKRSLVPTTKGLTVYDAVKEKQIANVELTGKWEKQLADIENGKTTYEDFMEGIKEFTRQTLDEIFSVKIASDVDSPYECPRCKSGKIKIFPKVVKCSNPGCDFHVFRTMCGKQISDTHVNQLMKSGKTSVIKGFKNKAGKPFDAALQFDENFNVRFVFADRK